MGSNPTVSAESCCDVAQLVEHCPHKALVPGSSPGIATRLYGRLCRRGCGACLESRSSRKARGSIPPAFRQIKACFTSEFFVGNVQTDALRAEVRLAMVPAEVAKRAESGRHRSGDYRQSSFRVLVDGDAKIRALVRSPDEILKVSAKPPYAGLSSSGPHNFLMTSSSVGRAADC